MVWRNAPIIAIAPITSAMATTTVATAVVTARIVRRRLSTGGDQPVTGAPNRIDQRAVQLHTQSPDVHLDDVGVTVEVKVPHVVEDVLLRQHLTGVAHQV